MIDELRKKIGWRGLEDALGITRQAIDYYKGRDLPAAWYFVIRDLCEKHDVAFDESQFDFLEVKEND